MSFKVFKSCDIGDQILKMEKNKNENPVSFFEQFGSLCSHLETELNDVKSRLDAPVGYVFFYLKDLEASKKE